jgi:hypothetical protein
VINDRAFGTYFFCSSSSAVPQSVTVEAFAANGTASGSASLVLAPSKTVIFGTRDSAALTEDVLMGSGVITAGAARILSTESKVMCSALIVDATNSTPISMVSLNVVAKLKQKAAN